MDPRTARKEAGLLARDVARIMGVSESYVTLFETGKRQLRSEHLYDYARAVGMADLVQALEPVINLTRKPNAAEQFPSLDWDAEFAKLD